MIVRAKCFLLGSFVGDLSFLLGVGVLGVFRFLGISILGFRKDGRRADKFRYLYR